MVKLFVDNREAEVPRGSTLLDAARKLGIPIPTLCFLDGRKPHTSCMVCMVKIANPDRLAPACGTLAEDGMVIESETEEVFLARKASLDLLLSEHAGDCLAPCHTLCPAGMNIPLVIRQVADGAMKEAIRTIRADIPLPGVLSRICPAPCEKGCRRARYDGTVSICRLERNVADWDRDSNSPYMPPCKPDKSKRVAIVGAGPTGLTAAYDLRREGYECVLYDRSERPGGTLWQAVAEQDLPRDVLQGELGSIEGYGVRFCLATRVGDNPSLTDLLEEFDAVLLALGRIQPNANPWLSHLASPTGVLTDAKSFMTSMPGVFAAGSVVRSEKLAVRAFAQGRLAAEALTQYLAGEPVTGSSREFTSRMGRLTETEMVSHLAMVETASSTLQDQCSASSLPETDIRAEAERCLQCDCNSVNQCKLRQYATEYHAQPSRFRGKRRTSSPSDRHPDIVHDPGKCILCGHCVHIAAEAGEDLGIAYIGRGFDVTVQPPFGRPIEEGLVHSAIECAIACPTGALVLKERARQELLAQESQP